MTRTHLRAATFGIDVILIIMNPAAPDYQLVRHHVRATKRTTLRSTSSPLELAVKVIGLQTIWTQWVRFRDLWEVFRILEITSPLILSVHRY